MIRILLADDQALIRSGIRSLLDAEDDIEVVAEAADGQQAVALAAEHRPDIALVDIQMPVLDGLEATRQIAADERLDSVRVVILTNFGLDEYIFRRAAGRGERVPAQGHRAGRAAAGAAGCHARGRVAVPGRHPPPDQRVRRPAAGRGRREQGWTASPTENGKWWPSSRTACPTTRSPPLMVLSPTTAKTHVSRAMIKLGARDRAQLVVFAYQAGLVTPRVAG